MYVGPVRISRPMSAWCSEVMYWMQVSVSKPKRTVSESRRNELYPSRRGGSLIYWDALCKSVSQLTISRQLGSLQRQKTQIPPEELSKRLWRKYIYHVFIIATVICQFGIILSVLLAWFIVPHNMRLFLTGWCDAVLGVITVHWPERPWALA